MKQMLKRHWFDISYAPLVVSGVITVIVIYLVYNQTRSILTERLREKLTAIVGTAALQFDAQEINRIRDENDLQSNELKKVISQMKAIRDNNQNLRYIYIWRKTPIENVLEFVADAEMLDPIDVDGNGLIEDTEIPPVPGEDYDISENPNIHEGFLHPIAEKEFILDKWGTFLSGFAPIRGKNGEVVAILGTDVEITDFNQLVNATLMPFGLLAVLLLLMLTIQTISLIRIWKSRVELVKELDRQKDELLGIVSHQLAQPISAAKWYLEMLHDGDLGKLTKEQDQHIVSMQSLAVNLSDLVGMILDVSRIQLGRMKIDRQPLDLNLFFKEILATIEPKAQEKSINFKKEMPEKLPTVLLDKRLTRMCFENLLSNAVKYTPERGVVRLTVKIVNNVLFLEVTDTGCGIPKVDQGKIFGKLFRASNTGSIEGNGFGLYVAKGAVESQGGKISFKSEEGKGTTFFVELPLQTT